MKIKSLLIIASISFLVGCSYLSKLTHEYSHPSDSKLTEIFNEQKADFEILVSMFLEDANDKTKHFWIGRENNFMLNSFPVERKQKYVELMHKLSIQSIQRGYEESEMIILNVTSDSKEIGNHEMENDRKGYAYIRKEVPLKIISCGETDFRDSGYKKIDEGWYIFHEIREGFIS